MADIFIVIASKVAEYLVDPVIQQLQYISRFHDNVKDLREQVDKLSCSKWTVNQSVESARRHGEEILPEVQKWLSNVDEITKEVGKLEDHIRMNKRCFNGSCPDWIFRYRTSKESMKRTSYITSLREEGKFKRVSRLQPLPGIEFLSSGEFMTFESRESAMNQIMEALKDDEISIVGVYGVRGVGKTELVKEVGKRVKEMKLFDKVVFGVVSEKPNLRKIQVEIGDMLGLKLKEESDSGRAGRLYKRLKNENKVVVILDDVCSSLELEKLGIPLDHKGCKVLLTTRKEYVCNAVGISRTKKVGVNALSEEESWSLFSRITDESGLDDVKREIVRECRGLPLILVTIGNRLRGKDEDEWRDEARQLKKSRETNKGNDGYDYEYINQD